MRLNGNYNPDAASVCAAARNDAKDAKTRFALFLATDLVNTTKMIDYIRAHTCAIMMCDVICFDDSPPIVCG